MANHEQDASIIFIHVEKVHTSQGSFDIYQASARRLEDIEYACTVMRDRGANIHTPNVLGFPHRRPFFSKEPIKVPGLDHLSATVYLAVPSQIDGSGR